MQLTLNQIESRKKLYLELKSLNESNSNIAYEMQISTAALRYFVKKYVYTSPQEKSEIVSWVVRYNSYVEQGLNISQVAQQFNISKSRLTLLRDIYETVSEIHCLRFKKRIIKPINLL